MSPSDRIEHSQAGSQGPRQPLTPPRRVGYVVKRYPRYSETFIVNEILAHEAAGLEIEIFTLFATSDTHFQDCISRVRAPVHYLTSDTHHKASELWSKMTAAAELNPGLWPALSRARGADARELHQALNLAALVRRRGITHLHAHFATSATSVARLASHFSGVPYTFTAHAKDIFHDSVEMADLSRKLVDAAAVVTVSDYNVNYLHERYGPAAVRVRRVYNGLDLSRFSFVRPDARDRLIVAVGRLVEKKGFDVLIDACAILRSQACSFRCRIIGEGDQEPRLRARIAELGLESMVELVGPRPQAEVFAELQRGAAFAAPCVIGSDGNRDGLPTVLLEAMALGTPCVAGDVTGVREVLEDGRTGLMVAQRDSAGLAAALRQLLDQPGQRVRLAAEARRLIERDFDIHRNAARIRQIFTGSADHADEGWFVAAPDEALVGAGADPVVSAEASQ